MTETEPRQEYCFARELHFRPVVSGTLAGDGTLAFDTSVITYDNVRAAAPSYSTEYDGAASLKARRAQGLRTRAA